MNNQTEDYIICAAVIAAIIIIGNLVKYGWNKMGKDKEDENRWQ